MYNVWLTKTKIINFFFIVVNDTKNKYIKITIIGELKLKLGGKVLNDVVDNNISAANSLT